jgi:hypothetical protein
MIQFVRLRDDGTVYAQGTCPESSWEEYQKKNPDSITIESLRDARLGDKVDLRTLKIAKRTQPNT